jgi:hypothetical protein
MAEQQLDGRQVLRPPGDCGGHENSLGWSAIRPGEHSPALQCRDGLGTSPRTVTPSALDAEVPVPDNRRADHLPSRPDHPAARAETPGGRMGKPHKLFNKFTNRKKRVESDCAVIQEIVDYYQTCADDASRKEALKWLFETMEDKDTKEIVRVRILVLLKALEDKLPGKKRRRLDKYERKIEAKKKDQRAERFTPEKAVVQERIERKKKRKQEKAQVA